MPVDNPFQLLGLPQSPRLGDAQINAAFRRAMLAAHPDFSGLGGSPDTLASFADPIDEAALAHAARLNAARDALLDPLLRCEALLLLAGGVGPGKDARTPEGFLMRIMEAREALDEARSAQDTPAADRVIRDATAERDAWLEVASKALEATPVGRDAARIALNAARSLARMLEHAQRTS